MEELFELKRLLINWDTQNAIAIVEELEEMGKKGIIKIIRSYGIILLIHLIKQQVEN